MWSNRNVLRRALLIFCASLPLLAADENLIDRHIEQKAKANSVPLAAIATDAAFIRRVTLDLQGRLPDVATTPPPAATNPSRIWHWRSLSTMAFGSTIAR
jgi:hypothetical protein